MSNFNDGENLRNSFAQSPELIFKPQRSQELNFAESDFVLDLRNSGILRQTNATNVTIHLFKQAI